MQYRSEYRQWLDELAGRDKTDFAAILIRVVLVAGCVGVFAGAFLLHKMGA